MSKPSVAFVILTWNSQIYIRDCLNSILKCESFDPCVFVVDNGSTDRTPQILHCFEENYDNLICAFLPLNFGTTVSRNLVLANIPAECEYVCVLDSDTIINEQAIMAMIALLIEDPSIGLVGPTMINSAGEEQFSGRSLPNLGIKLRKAFPAKSVQAEGARLEIPDTPRIGNTQDVPYLISACWFMPRATLEAVGLLDENIFYAPEDVDYCVRVAQAGLRVVRCWNAQIVHEYQRISHKKLFSKTNVEHVKGLVYYFKKHGYLFDVNKPFKKKIGHK